MQNNSFDSLLRYKSTMAQARIMLSKNLITADEYSAIEQKMCEIFGINFDSLYRDNDWIKTPVRVNMSPRKEEF